MIRLLALLAAFLAGTAGSAAAAQRFIPLLQPGDAVPPIPLVAQNGRPFTLADFRGDALAVSFIYTRCADARMCPLVSAKFARAQHILGAAPIHLVVLTLDPAFDTPAVLARYGHAFGQDPRSWTLGTGAPAMLEELAGRFGIATSTTRPGSIIHTEALVIIAPDGRLAQTVYGNDWTPDELVAAARAVLPGSGDRFAGLRGWLRAAAERCGASAFGLNGTAMLVIFGIALVAAGAAFGRAFRTPAGKDA